MQITEADTVGEIAAAEPASVRVFESLGIDYCCGGKRGLAEACSRIGVSVEDVMNRIAEAGKKARDCSAPAWPDASLATIILHILERHHARVRTESARVGKLLGKVVARHGNDHPEIAQMRDLFLAATQELSTHMLKEEQVLFPHIVRMEEAIRAGQPLPTSFFGSVSRPIAHMVADHDDAGAVFSKIRQLAGGYVPPQDACATFRALYQNLDEFERDLHEHVHLENNVLFPRAVEMERGNRRPQPASF